jgi:predicted permease
MLNELWSDVRYRARALFCRGAMERELDAELRAHIEHQAEAFERGGLPPDEARRRAVIAFGGLEPMKEHTRDARGTRLVESLLQDARYALRVLRKQPAFTLAVVLVLAIGIGANTATFTVINGLLLRRLPVPHPEQLVTIGDPAAVHQGWHGSPVTDYVSYPLYSDIRDRTHVLSGLFASGSLDTPDVIVRGHGTAPPVEHPNVRLVTGNYFGVLDVPAFRGRTFTGEEDRVPHGDPFAVIGYGYWQRRFAGDPSAVGSELTMNGVALTIVGVTPAGFTGEIAGESIDIWVPMMMQPALDEHENLLESREASWLQMMGRLAPGLTLAQARTSLIAIETQAVRAEVQGRLLEQLDGDLKSDPIRVESGITGFSQAREEYSAAIFILMAGVGLVVLIVCANVANLMLVRGVARRREMTVRLSLGAGRGRLIRQLFTESAVLAVAGGALGLAGAQSGSALLLAVASRGRRPVNLDLAPDARVFLFTAAVTLMAVLLFGLIPALWTTRVDLATSLRMHARNLFGGRTRVGGFAPGRLLVVVQIALSMVLLISAGLLTRSMQRIVSADLGVDRDHVLFVHVSARKSGYEGARVQPLVRDLLDRVQRLPGVAGASVARYAMFSGGFGEAHIVIPGEAPRPDAEREVFTHEVGPNHFHTMGAHLLRGRDIDPRDGAGAPRVAIVNETLAKQFFPGVDPIGRTLLFDGDAALGGVHTIVGEVADVREHSLRGHPVRRVYLSLLQQEPPPGFWIETRVAGAPSGFVPPIRTAILSAAPGLDLEIHRANDLVLSSVADDVLVTGAMSAFGLIALLLAAIGLYGVTAYSTSQRTAELGLRMALGAEPGSVARMIVREAVALAAVGVGIGIPAGLAATRVIRAQMFAVTPFDPASWSAAVLVLAGTALAASYLPARRAARIAPIDALRAE